MTDAVDRKFERLRRDGPEGNGYAMVPRDGMCLSAFLLVHPHGAPTQFLLGRVDPAQPWDHIGGLTRERLRDIGTRWMLPSSHLLEYEEPAAAAHRIAAEQLERPDLTLAGPEVRSEAYRREGRDDPDLHWDLHFLFRGEWPEGKLVRARPWSELRFFDMGHLPPEGVARGGRDILELAGYH
ncbi:MAG TPA: hypothetical protein VGV89_04535 [Thermoplasmata archaeon]|nr:hypothetical protein [Thermoplasmata archaeon]